jgi:hypothetical protein
MIASWNTNDSAQSNTQVPPSAQIEFIIRSVHPALEKDNSEWLSQCFQELKLVSYLNDIRNGRRPVSEWTGFQNVAGASVGVRAFIDAVKDDCGTDQELEMGDALPSRKDMDFTDKVWSFVTRTVNQQDLLSVMVAVAESLEQGELQPLVAKSNRTVLADLVRESLKLATIQTSGDVKEMAESLSAQFDFWLEDRNPEPSPVIELVIDIGIEKLYRDYMFWLSGEGMLTRSQIIDFLETDSKTEKIKRLHALFRVVEVAHLVKRNVMCFSETQLRSFVKQAFEYWEDVVKRDDVISLADHVEYRFLMPAFSLGASHVIKTIASSFNPSMNVTRTSSDAGEVRMVMTSSDDWTQNAGFNFDIHKIEDLESLPSETHQLYVTRGGIDVFKWN